MNTRTMPTFWTRTVAIPFFSFFHCIPCIHYINTLLLTEMFKCNWNILLSNPTLCAVSDSTNTRARWVVKTSCLLCCAVRALLDFLPPIQQEVATDLHTKQEAERWGRHVASSPLNPGLQSLYTPVTHQGCGNPIMPLSPRHLSTAAPPFPRCFQLRRGPFSVSLFSPCRAREKRVDRVRERGRDKALRLADGGGVGGLVWATKRQIPKRRAWKNRTTKTQVGGFLKVNAVQQSGAVLVVS